MMAAGSGLDKRTPFPTEFTPSSVVSTRSGLPTSTGKGGYLHAIPLTASVLYNGASVLIICKVLVNRRTYSGKLIILLPSTPPKQPAPRATSILLTTPSF